MNQSNLEIPDLPGVSLVAYYHDKPSKLSLLIQSIQKQLKQIYGDRFLPYDLGQIHGTIIGCEGVRTHQGIVNKWFYKHRNKTKYADFSGLLDYLSNTQLLPLKIRFAGYQKEVDYQFLSRGKHPSDRSFQLQNYNNQQLVPVLIGWSSNQQQIATNFQQIRYNCQQYNFLHKYYRQEQDIDNDFYLKLGTITKISHPNQDREAEQIIIECLQKIASISIELNLNDLSLVRYQDSALSLNSTEHYPVDRLNLSSDFINYLYQ